MASREGRGNEYSHFSTSGSARQIVGNVYYQNTYNYVIRLREADRAHDATNTNTVPPNAAEAAPTDSVHPTHVVGKANSLSSLSLDGVSELNILVVGASGVGKSTFINAFMNYCTYESFDVPLEERKVACVIPSFFTWDSLVDDTYVAQKIEMMANTGDHDNAQSGRDEHDSGEGGAATQRSKCYRMQIGIGDTRGVAQDAKNLREMLSKLGELKELHGIVILLRPNETRLDVMFKFCLKQLLMRFHRSAAKNIVFCFTNARNISFRPGGTYHLLKYLFEDDPAIDLRLSRDTTYFVDSESFRNGVVITDPDDLHDYRSSWAKSAKEMRRLLEHFIPRVTAPHQLESTLGLNRTRNAVRLLIPPLANLGPTITHNIELLQEDLEKMQAAIARGEELQAALYITKVIMEAVELEKPSLVCSNAACIEVRHDDSGMASIFYKTVCEDPCYLTDVSVDATAHPEFLELPLFNKGKRGECVRCGHSWTAHLHQIYEVVKTSTQLTDPAVAQCMKDNADGVDAQKACVKSREESIANLEAERKTIQEAMGQFSVFLLRSAVMPYNDTVLEYIDRLIEDEQAKVQLGAPDSLLEGFRSDRNQHVEEIRVLTEYAQAGIRDRLLDQKALTI